MNIAIDISFILLPLEDKNRNTYIKFLENLINSSSNNKYYILNFYENINLKKLFNYGANVKELYYNCGKDNLLLHDKKYNNILKQLVRRIDEENNIDIFYFTNIFNKSFFYNADWFETTQIGIISFKGNLDYYEKNYFIDRKEFFEKAKNLIINSSICKDNLVDYFKIDVNKISIIKDIINEEFILIKNFSDRCVEEIKKNNLDIVFKNKKKKKLAFFTPLNPIKSGISDYSFDIINGLVKYYDIDIFIDDNYFAQKNLFGRDINIYNHKKYEEQKDKYFETIYQVGNSSYHIYMFYYIKTYSGIVVLHDTNLHHVVQYMVKEDMLSINQYKQMLIEECNSSIKIRNSIIELIERIESNKAHEIILNGIAINYANKIIVHSNYAAEKLLNINIGRKIKKIELYSKIDEVKDIYEAKKELGISADFIVISVFGHIQETKRIMPIIESINHLRIHYPNIKLFLVGKPNESMDKQLRNYIDINNLCENVLITEYIELEKFETYIQATDICLNLRYPYNGENSASLTRILAKGKCVVVNDIGSFSELPNDVVIKIPSAHNLSLHEEYKNIYDTVKNLIDSPNDAEAIGRNARIYAQQYLDLEIISTQYKNFIEELVENTITENLLREISKKYKKEEYNNEQIYEFSRTLAFSAGNVKQDIIYKKLIKNIFEENSLLDTSEIDISKKLKLNSNRFRKKKLVIWGAGIIIDKLLKYYEFEFEYFIDNNPTKIGTKHLKKIIYSSKKLLEDKDEIIVIVAVQRYYEIFKLLDEMGFKKSKNYYSIYEFIDKIG